MEKQGGRYTVRFVNHGYSADERFETAREAVAYGLLAHFEFAVDRASWDAANPSTLVCGWTVFGGLRWYNEIERAAFAKGGAR